MDCFAVILAAAGWSQRFGGSKLTARLGGRTVLQWAVGAFLGRADVSRVVIATSDYAAARAALTAAPGTMEILSNPKLDFCRGGPSRAHSVALALEAVPAEAQWVAVHDAARPLVSAGLIDRAFAAAREHGAAAPALAVAQTIKRAGAALPAAVRETVARQELWAMQTPQIMRRADLAEAIARCPMPLEQITDDAQLLELIGKPVWLIAGEERNLKITHAMDVRIAELWAAGRAS